MPRPSGADDGTRPRDVSGPQDVPRLQDLARAKARLGTTLSVCLPARNEEATIGAIVGAVRERLVEGVALVDEIVVIDDHSTDATARKAARAGARVLDVSGILPDLPSGSGKGNALWLSLYATSGALICWVDADIRNFTTEFVTRLVAPLLDEPGHEMGPGFVKAYYRRPLDDAPRGGGRVTELMARPLLSALFPHLSHIVQPLAGEFAGRREVLEAVPFMEGWGVELGLLIDIATTFGVDAIAQCDLGVREHRNRSLIDLGPQAMEILVSALRRARVGRAELASTLVQFDDDHEPVLVPIEVRERPPMITVPAYRAKFGRELSA
jgi:glucosyl-3-phosphoglycerate synthase